MIFSRRRGAGRHARDERSGRPGTDPSAATREDRGRSQLDQVGDGPAARDRGPYDVADTPTEGQWLDLGSLRIPAVPEIEIRVQADPDGAIQQVVLVHGGSALQLGVFAAPRSAGIWDEVRQEIRDSLSAEGVLTEEVPGEYGPELRARVATPEGPTELRFVGVDGPRWMLRAVYQGAAAVDPDNAGPLTECLRNLVVDRGREAKPVREPLPLRLPREAAQQSPDGGSGPAAGPSLNGATPVRRGGAPHPGNPG